METRGKLGRRVPILLRENHIKYIETYLKYREAAGVYKSNPYLFGINDSGFLRQTDIMRRESVCSGAKRPELLRATFFRKQVATTSQVLNLNDNEIQLIADFMGHDIKIHKMHYRTPDIILQVARLSKLLIAVDEGNFSSYKDKNLQNIDVAKYLNITNDTEIHVSENVDSGEDETEELMTTNSPIQAGNLSILYIFFIIFISHYILYDNIKIKLGRYALFSTKFRV